MIEKRHLDNVCGEGLYLVTQWRKMIKQDRWLNEFLNDYGYTDADYRFNVAYDETGEAAGPAYQQVYNELCKLPFPELMDKYNLPCVSEDDFNWLLSMGWKDKDDKAFISQECFEHIKRLLDDGSIVFQ